MDRYDVLIVGGGPAGSTCAWKLRQAGLHVLVIDKKRFPRDKPCAGWITPQVVEALQLDVEAYRQDRTWQSITGFQCGMIGGQEVLVRYDETISFGMRRYEFDAYLLSRAGAVLRLDEPVEQIGRESGGWVINGAYAAPLLVGAGGNFCPVARRLAARRESLASVVVAQEGEFVPEGDSFASVRADTPALFFCNDLRGYGWCFRKGDFINVGIGRTEADDFPRHVAQFRQFLSDRGMAGSDGDRPWKGHAYQLYDHAPPQLLDDGVLLIGDAAGLAYAQSGEGIRPAVESALIAADVILKAGGSYRRDDLAAYRTRLEARLGRPQPSLLSRLPAAWLPALAARLLASRWFSRHIVMDRWFLHRSQPALMME